MRQSQAVVCRFQKRGHRPNTCGRSRSLSRRFSKKNNRFITSFHETILSNIEETFVCRVVAKIRGVGESLRLADRRTSQETSGAGDEKSFLDREQPPSLALTAF